MTCFHEFFVTMSFHGKILKIEEFFKSKKFVKSTGHTRVIPLHSFEIS